MTADAAQRPPMRRAVLVPGGMHGSWCWEQVLPHLVVEATALDLPGREGAGPWPDSLSGWADAIAGAARDSTDPALLVAHSLGGLAALAALPRVHSHVAGILLVAAVVPASGQSYWDLVPKISRRIGRTQIDGRTRVLMPRPIARLILCHDLSPSDSSRLLDRMTPESDSVLATPVSYDIPNDIDVGYVRTLKDRVISPKKQRRYATSLPERTRHFQLDSGHSVTYARPKELATIINTAAGGTGPYRCP